MYFPLRSIRAGQKYTTFIHEDSLYAPHLDYLAYEISTTEYVVFGFHDNDSVSVRKDSKPYTLRRTKKSAVINSSLWGAIMEHDLPYVLAAEMEDIYQWTVDFFGIQKGDSFTVIYDERFIDDTVSAGIGRVWGAKFTQSGKGVLRRSPSGRAARSSTGRPTAAACARQLLKAPLKYTRIQTRASPTRANTRYTRFTGRIRAWTTPRRKERPYTPWPTAWSPSAAGAEAEATRSRSSIREIS